MHRDKINGSHLQSRRGILRAIGVGGAAITIGATRSLAAEGDLVCQGTMPPELIGRFVDSFGHHNEIEPTRWWSLHDGEEFLHHICSLRPEDGYLIAQNDQEKSYYPNQFSRFEWMIKDGDIWYCQQVFSAGDMRDAADFVRFPAANGRDPAAAGCGETGSFAWSKLTAKSAE